MSKYKFLEQKNIVPVHKTLVLEYEEEYSGEKQELITKIYPFTLEEKMKIKNKTDKVSEDLKSDNETIVENARKEQEENTYKTIHMVLVKDDPTITTDIIKRMPDDWYDKIVMKALEFEGITEDVMKENLKKKITQ